MAAISMEIDSGIICAPSAIGKSYNPSKAVSNTFTNIMLSLFLYHFGLISDHDQDSLNNSNSGSKSQPSSFSPKRSHATLSIPERGCVPELTSPSTSAISTTTSLLNSVQKTFKKETLKRALFKDISTTNRKKQPLPKEELEYLESLKSLKLNDGAQQELKHRMQQLDQSIHQKFQKCNDIEQLSELVQNYFIKVADSMERRDSQFYSLSLAEKTDALNFIESCVISRNHK